jgi:antirestriction protein ArdC
MSKQNEIKKEYLNTIQNLKEIMLENPKWIKDWAIGIRNIVSNTSYSILNQLFLSLEMRKRGYKEPYFATFKQIKEAGAKLKKGSKGFTIWFYKPLEITKEVEKEVVDIDENGEEVVKTEIVQAKKTIPLLKRYIVFNVEDIEGIEIPNEESLEISKREIFEKVSDEVTLTYGNPAWVVGEKKILMPKVADFKTKDAFIAALFHEFSHYTHWKIGLMDLKADNYAFDEVVAETSAAVLCNIYNIDYPLERHAAYLKSWGKKLDDKEFEKALKEAGKVVEDVVKFLENTQAVDKAA